MGKAVKKRSRRLWRTVRKTLGTLFLVSALVIAAIPVDYLRATGTEDGIEAYYTVDRGSSSKVKIVQKNQADNQGKIATKIPYVGPGEQIYNTADGSIQFAFVTSDSSGSNRVAVILGCAKDMVVNDKQELIIPPKVDAYKLYSSNSTTGGYVAAGHKGNALFYAQKTYYTATDSSGNTIYTDASGNPSQVPVENVSERKYLPCYTTDQNWKSLPAEEFYCLEDEGKSNITNADYKQTTGDYSGYQRIYDADVWYVGNQYLTYAETTIGATTYKKWTVAGYIDEDNLDKGVFYDTNAKTVVGSEYLRGIGNSAFGKCIYLETFNPNSNLAEIGNFAFKDCKNLKSIEVKNIAVKQIGKRAFAGCEYLTSFDVPNATTAIGDSAFEGCIRLSTVDLCGDGGATNLEKMGWDVFKGCEVLTGVTFPNSYSAPIDLSMFAGCKDLDFIAARNKDVDFTAQDGYSLDDFRGEVGKAFYFEGAENSKAYDFAKRNYFTFSRLKSATENYEQQDVYELTVPEENTGNSTTFRVNSKGELLFCGFNGNVSVLKFPPNIGKYSVNIIKEGVFGNKCNLRQVHVSSTVEFIGKNAFRGCHRLTDVFFESGETKIEPEAFMTQDFTGTHDTKSGCLGKEDMKDSDGSPKNKLHFVGSISPTSGPFNYAMSNDGKYSVDAQIESYIAYYSGWPQNLKVEYDPTMENPHTKEKGMSVLTDFPSLKDIKEGFERSGYSYLTEDEKDAARDAWKRYGSEKPTQEGKEIINSALNIRLPEGIEAIQQGLVKRKEDENIAEMTKKPGLDIRMTIAALGLAEVKTGVTTKDEKTGEEQALRDLSGKIIVTGGEGTFTGCEYLTAVALNADSKKSPLKIEPYAFANCSRLGLPSYSDYNDKEDDDSISGVSLANVSEFKTMPFLGCENLDHVDFQSSPNYVCNQSIILGLENGKPNSIIECLEGRTSDVIKAELGNGIGKIEREAFRRSKVESIDLSETSIRSIPEGTFAETPELSTVRFPETLTKIWNYAFAGSNVKNFYVPGRDTGMAPFAFDDTYDVAVKRYGERGLMRSPTTSVTWYYNLNIPESELPDTETYMTGKTPPFSLVGETFETNFYVLFTYRDKDGNEVSYDAEGKKVSDVEVAKTKAPLNVPKEYTKDGVRRTFQGWGEPETIKINGRNTWKFEAKYDDSKYTVFFKDNKDDNTKEIYRTQVAPGGNAIRKMEGEVQQGGDGDRDVSKIAEVLKDENFVGWTSDGEDLENVQGDCTATAKYKNPDEFLLRFYVKEKKLSDPWKLLGSITRKKNDRDPILPFSVSSVMGDNGKEYEFKGWDQSLSEITKSTDFYAEYQLVGSGSGGGSGSGDGSGSGSGSGDGSGGGSGSGDGSGGGSGSGGGGSGGSGNNGGTAGAPTPGPGQHRLEVRDGTPVSGFYAKDAQIIITANTPAEGMEFDGWDVLPAEVVIADKTRSTTIITMPDKDVAVLAKFKSKSGTGSGNSSQNSGFYSLLVHKGSGSGMYAAGKQIIITADEAPEGQVFSSWTVSPEDTVVTDKAVASAIITMPAYDVAVIANYKSSDSVTTTTTNPGTGTGTGTGNDAGTGTGTDTGTGTGTDAGTGTGADAGTGTGAGTGTDRRPTGGVTGVIGGSGGSTTVIIDKNGLSNTAVVSATVNGSSDNFTIKVTESSAAAESILRALQAEYGSVDNIKYFPMDISLYDSTGTTKITDTTGLAVNVTLPLPDSLIPYAGNNKVAGVVNDRLDKLTPKFTTISGVPCVTFTAEHFSPYVIYVDITRLSDGTISDSTPKTGDGIHPKWFLSIGLACLSFVMFMMKDSRGATKKRQKVAVRARR